ncbi:MAG: hypothetical protein UY16_C0030G0015, partial [Candidatus Gottesmanbacteria bacterium GW2011_GWA2_47_9]
LRVTEKSSVNSIPEVFPLSEAGVVALALVLCDEVLSTASYAATL